MLPPSLRIVFFGTGTFGGLALQQLLASQHAVIALVTGPDRQTPAGKPIPHPMKEAAAARGLRVLQPAVVNGPAALEELRALAADLYIVADYGQILSRELIEIPRLGAVNLHGSILPRHRGAAPIQYAILAGDEETGVSIFQIEPRLDAGPILGIVRTPVTSADTSATVEARLAELAAPLTLQIVDQLAVGATSPLLQDKSLATKAPKWKKEMGIIDWNQSALAVDRLVRAAQPWPLASTHLLVDGRDPLRLILLGGEVRDCPPEQTASSPGSVLAGSPGELLVRCGTGAYSVKLIQPVGKRAMPITDFLNGRTLTPGMHLGTPS